MEDWSSLVRVACRVEGDLWAALGTLSIRASSQLTSHIICEALNPPARGLDDKSCLSCPAIRWANELAARCNDDAQPDNQLALTQSGNEGGKTKEMGKDGRNYC
ncbi:uncharacterized protein MCYG_07107 [Microsporum canis CBS 113480]|uniref:Uncharacterized protein n=1 Tax=Arthroderma otae (strain ATCC MYA-4605 / CBS 113480) TaxID=554155 RepID=C5FWK4_ARTOC|nr:uncharacterized protein MCYG_07107 [Microsporum canis CBS 113480]EEQ34288.1 predicted protein [Microsporum canis CBS 113480]